MNSYRYKVTVEQIADEKGQAVDGRSLMFEAACHDDLLELVNRVREKRVVANANASAAMMVGLKLFGEIALAERKNPMFADVHAALGSFIRALKELPMQTAGSGGRILGALHLACRADAA